MVGEQGALIGPQAQSPGSVNRCFCLKTSVWLWPKSFSDKQSGCTGIGLAYVILTTPGPANTAGDPGGSLLEVEAELRIY